MKELRAHTQQQVELELEALRAIRCEAEAAAAQMCTEMVRIFHSVRDRDGSTTPGRLLAL